MTTYVMLHSYIPVFAYRLGCSWYVVVQAVHLYTMRLYTMHLYTMRLHTMCAYKPCAMRLYTMHHAHIHHAPIHHAPPCCYWCCNQDPPSPLSLVHKALLMAALSPLPLHSPSCAEPS